MRQGNKSSKDLIVSILSEEFPLPLKKIFFEVKRQGASISYQGVHKSLTEMLAQGIIEKDGNKFRLSKKWINEISFFSKKLLKAYSSETVINYMHRENTQLCFDTLKDFDRFFIFEYFNFPNSVKKPVIAHWFHMYSLIGLSEDDILALKEFISKNDFYILCSGETPLDKFFGETFKKLGCRIKLGAKGDASTDHIIFGDYLLQAYWPKEIKAAIKRIFSVNSIEEFKLSSLLKLMHGKIEPIHVMVNKNSGLAEKIRQENLKQFCS